MLNDPLDLLTPEQACEVLGGITTKTLREWNKKHRYKATLAPIRLTHKTVRYKKKNLLTFLEQCRSCY